MLLPVFISPRGGNSDHGCRSVGGVAVSQHSDFLPNFSTPADVTLRRRGIRLGTDEFTAHAPHTAIVRCRTQRIDPRRIIQ